MSYPNKENLFEFYENESIETLVAEYDGYSLFKVEKNYGRSGYIYLIYDPNFAFVTDFFSYKDIEKSPNYKKTNIYAKFLSEVNQDKSGIYKYDDDDLYNDEFEQSYPFEKSDPWKSNSVTSRFFSPQVKKTGYLEKLCKSDTLVFHKDDPSTRMLCQVYEGKGWDVLTTSCNNIDDEEVKELFARHDRLVFLGHGTSYGLLGMFGPEVAPYMKNKKIFAIWCNADGYFKKYGIGEGQFVTGNMPSEVWECSAAGCGRISKELMLENITYWSKLCADVVEECLEGNPQRGVDYVRKKYLEMYGNHPVTIYNCNRTQVLGNHVQLPKYEFKGKKLEPIDYPIPYFDEEEFLKHPVEKAWECPKIKNAPAEPEYNTTKVDLFNRFDKYHPIDNKLKDSTK